MSLSTEQKQPSEYQDNLQILMEIPFFSGLPLEALKLIAYFCTRETFNPGEAVFNRGEVDGHAYYILEGKGSLIIEETELPPVKTIAPGDFIGGLSLLGDMKRLFTLKVDEKIVCIVITRGKFLKTLKQFPDIVGKIMESVVAGVYQWELHFMREHAEACSACKAGIGVSLL